jgi:circadian clock protein KaiC
MKKADGKSIELESTGDPALDSILGGGIPSRSVVIVAGEPGSGKTVMTLQMVFAAAARGKRSLYFTTLSEPAVKVMRFMQHFEFFDQAVLDQQTVVLADLGRFLREGAQATLAELERRVADAEPDFVVIDSFKAIAELLRQESNARPMIYDLAVQMSAWGATSLLVGEYARAEISQCPEFGIADGILRLGSERQGLASVRELEVLKLRGSSARSGVHFFDIGARGASFYPRVSAPGDDPGTEPEGEARAAMGVAGLDELLGGGVPERGTTLIEGGTGTGKTLLAVHFLLQGIRQGERGVLFTMEETPAQLRSVMRGLGIDLASLEARGDLVIRYTSPVELSSDRFLYEARSQLGELGARRAVFDSLTTMSLGVPSERRFKEMVYAITKHLRGMGITSVMTMESAQLLGSSHLTGDGVSFIADNVIQLRYLEIEGRLERAISVLKARGVKHDSELRSMTIGEGGVTIVAGRFRDLRGVLTGIPAEKAPR